MSRSFYLIAAVLIVFAMLSAGASMVPSSFQPGLPANGSLWRTLALIFLLAGLASALAGVMTHLFEQIDRHNAEERQTRRRGGRSGRK